MPRPQLSFRTEWQGDQACLFVAGEIDLLTAASLVETAGELLGKRPVTLVVDLSQVSFCDSAGVAAFVKIYHQAATVSAQLRIRGAADMVRHVLEISGVDRVIPIDDSPVG